MDDLARRWWLDTFYAPHRLTPEGMGDLITKSVTAEKSIIYGFIDDRDHSFFVRIQDRFRDNGEVWFVERTLRPDGALFSADAMFVPSGDQQSGRGRRLMRDLMAAALMLGLSSISVEA